MIIKSVRLRNIRSYEDSGVIKFAKGTILFEGDIGSGKTTILMAIEFALFGNSERGFYEKLLRKGAMWGDVEIVFEHDDEIYTVYRKIIKNKRGGISNDETYVITPEGKRHLSPLEIKSFILGIMGVDVGNKFRRTLPVINYAIYTPQETMKEILGGKEEERLEVIRKIFHLDEYKIARDNASIILSGIKGELRAIDAKKEELERINIEIEKLQEMIDAKKKKLEDIKAQMREMKKNIDALKKSVEDMEHRRKSYEELKRQIERYRSELKSRGEEIEHILGEIAHEQELKEKLKALDGAVAEYNRTASELEKLRVQMDIYEELSKRENKLKVEIKAIEDMIEERDKLLAKIREMAETIKSHRKNLEKKSSLENELNELEDKLKVLREIKAKNTQKLEDANTEIEKYRSLGAVCPTCQRPLDETHKRKLIDEAERKIEKLREAIRNINGKISRYESSIKQLKNEILRIHEIEKKVSAIEGEKESREKRIKDIETKIEAMDKLKTELESITQKLKELGDIKEKYRTLEERKKSLEAKRDEYRKLQLLLEEIEKKRSRLETLKKKQENLRKALKDAELKLAQESYDEEEHRKLVEKYRALYGEYRNMEGQYRSVEEELGENLKELERKNSLKNELEKRIAKGKRLEEIGNWLGDKFIPALEDIEKMRLLQINEEFRALFEKWFYELLGESDYEATVDENFTPIVRYDKYDMPISSLSGGERTSVALAYRLSLNTMVKRALGLRTNILILDEPTDGFSKDQLYKLKDIFEQMETDQIIIVSHEKELMNIADAVYHVEKSNGRSVVKILR